MIFPVRRPRAPARTGRDAALAGFAAVWSAARAAVCGIALLALSGQAQAAGIAPRWLVEVSDPGSPVISPDGGRVAFRVERASIERNTHDSDWYVQALEGTAPPLRVADGGVPLRDSAGVSLDAPATWSPDGRWIYYRALVEGRIEVWRAAADGARAERVTRDPADVRGFVLSADGGALMYRVGATREDVRAAERREYDRGIRVDASTPIGQNLFRSGYIEGRLATQRLGAWFDRVPLLAETADRWKAVDLSTGSVRVIPASEIPPPPPSVADLAGRSPAPWALAQQPASGRIALLTHVGDATGLLVPPGVQLSMLPDARASRPVVCSHALCTGKAITGLQWRADGDEVVFTVTDPDEGLAQSIFLWDVATGAVRQVAQSRGLLGGGRSRLSGCGVSSRALACVAASTDRPPRLERIDLDTGERHVRFDPNAALAEKLGATVAVRLLRWSDAAGQRFTGQYYPARRSGDGAPPPLFVTYYLCPGFVRGGLGDEWPLATLAAHGVSALCINAAPYRTDAARRYGDGLSAVESAVALLASRGEIDRRRVGMGGLSFAAETTLWTTVHSDLIAAASVGSPAISQLYQMIGSNRGDAFVPNLQRLWQVGAPEQTPERWKALSPALNLDRIDAPILMQLPEQEFIHALDYAIPLMKDGRSDVYVFPHEPHQKFQPRHKLAVYERNLDWFRFWLLGVEDEDVAKAGQYAHWRTMRAHSCARAGTRGRGMPAYCVAH